MAKTETQVARTKRWVDRITTAEKVREAWEKRFNPTRLQEYWEGFQWGETPEVASREKYTINLVYAAIEAMRPSLLFHRPTVKMTPQPGKGDTMGSDIREQAQLCEETVQTLVNHRTTHFDLETKLALHEAFFRFGVIEVGYTADWVDNPNAGKPVLTGDTDAPLLDEDNRPIPQPARKMTHEQLFVKRIPAHQFLVSVSSTNAVDHNDWVAYQEWHYVEDVKSNPDYENLTNLKASGVLHQKLRSGEPMTTDELERRHGMVCLWKLWDLREKKRYVLAEGHPKPLVDGASYTVFPFAVLKFHERLNDFYPLPLVFNWRSPQDEINEIREAQRTHRRRFPRRYTYRIGAIEPTELDKLETGEDGAYAGHTGPPGEIPLVPVPDAPLDGSIWTTLGAAKDDFAQVTGSTGEQRGIPQSSTATQANIVNQNQQIRENSARLVVAEWLAQIARIILETVRDKMTLPFWIEHQVDPTAPGAVEDAIRIAGLWTQITADKLGDLDYDIAIDLASLSPVTQSAQQATWDEMLRRMTDEAILGLIAQSPYLLRRTLRLSGIRNETDIRAIEESLQARFLQLQMQQLAHEGGSPASTGEASPPSEVMPQAGVPAGTGSLE